jgi:small-conductance mechanosensitive channel
LDFSPTRFASIVGVRVTLLVNFSGTRTFVPNRSITNVSDYPNSAGGMPRDPS